MASVGDLLVSRQLATDGDSSYHNGEPDALPAHAAQLFNGSSASIAEPSTSTSTSAVADEPPRRKRQRQRERRKLSCLECHKRKQQCDKGTPCSRCIKRGVTHLCSYDSADVGSSGSNGISSSDLPLPVLGRQHHQLPATAAATNGAGTDNTSQKVAALESLIRAHMGPKADSLLESIHSRAPSGSGANPEHNAAAALGQLANAHDGISDGQYAYHGPGSVANFIAGSEFLPKIEVSVPLHKPRDLLSAYAFVQSIPPAPVADELTTLFWGTSFPRLFAAATRTEYEPKFAALLQWRDMVKAGGGDPNAIPLPLSGALATVALLAICCAIAFQFGPEAKCDEIAQRAGLGQRRAFQHNMMALARACLYQSEEDEPPSLARIEGLLLCGCYNKNEGRPSSNYSLAAQAVRTAQTLGMHREGSNTWRMSPYEAERRRRLWWSLYSYDHFSSFTLGRPHVIHDDDVDVAEPANINFDDLLPGQPVPPSRPLDEPTDETTVLIEIKLARLCGRMSQAVFSVKRSSIQTVARFDKQLRELQESIPARYLSPTAEDLQRNPALPTISTLTIMKLTWAHMVLHRSCLLKKIPTDPAQDTFAPSRRLVVGLAQKLLSLQRSLHLLLGPEDRKMFFYSFNVFDAVTTIALSVLQDPSESKRVEELDRWICDGRRMLTDLGNGNVIAVESVSCIDAFRQRIASLAPSGTNLAPLNPVSDGPVRIPYLNLTYSATPSMPAMPTPAVSVGSTPLDLDTPKAGDGLSFDTLTGGALPTFFSSASWAKDLELMNSTAQASSDGSNDSAPPASDWPLLPESLEWGDWQAFLDNTNGAR